MFAFFSCLVCLFVCLFLLLENHQNVKVIASEECVSQHRLVVGDLALALVGARKVKKKKQVPRLRVWRLAKEEVSERFRARVEELAEQAVMEESVDSRWSVPRNIWLQAAEEVCGWTKGEPRHKESWWWTEEVRIAVDEKRRRFNIWKSSGEKLDRLAYLEAKQISRRQVWMAQDAKRREFAADLRSGEGRRQFFKIAKQMAKERQDVTGGSCVKDEDGNIVTDTEGVQEVWRRYMERLLNVENEWDREVESEVVEGPFCLIKEWEVAQALKRTKSGKAAGPSGVVSEMMKASAGLSVQWMTALCNSILAEGRIPTDWQNSILVPLFKGKGDPLECGSFRAIKLLEQAMKVWERVLEVRLRMQVKIDEMQFGFMPGRGTTDAIFIVRQLQEKFLAKKKKLYLGFVDLEKAFDRVPREVVRWALRKRGVEEWLVRAVMMLYTGASTVARTGAGDSRSFEVKVGVHQGSVLSPLLFATVLEVVSSETRGGLPWELLYADDLVLIAETREQLQAKMAAWRVCLASKGLKINAGKTKVMVSRVSGGPMTSSGAWPCGVCGKGVAANSIQCTACRKWVHKRCSGLKGSLQAASTTFICKRCRGDGPRPEEREAGLEVCGDTYEVVESFCYLGDMLGAEGGADAAVTSRVRSGWKKFRELAPFLTSKAPPLKMKGQVYTACVRSSMMYGCETWPTRVGHIQQMERAEMRMIRWMCGVSLADRLSSEELRRRVGVEGIGTLLRRHRLRWFGHVERKEDTNWVKRCTNLTVGGPTPIGRPRKTWQSSVSDDMRLLGVNARDAMDRAKWRRAIARKQANPEQTGQRP